VLNSKIPNDRINDQVYKKLEFWSNQKILKRF